jgi:hypothetical protein
MVEETKSGTDKRFGVLYFHDSNPEFARMGRMSIRSLQRFHPHWPIRIVKCHTPRKSLPRVCYRAISFWRKQARLDRANQDVRVISEKARVMLSSPFDTTLYLDVDTVIIRPLDNLLEQACNCDVLITPLSWLHYHRFEDGQPETWPELMAGVIFYSRRFREIYKPYVEKYAAKIPKLPTQEQIILSLTCHQEASRLEVVKDPTLQFDVLNAHRHFAQPDYPRTGECVDISNPELQRFHIFHYNDKKPQYMKQIQEVWGISTE